MFPSGQPRPADALLAATVVLAIVLWRRVPKEFSQEVQRFQLSIPTSDWPDRAQSCVDIALGATPLVLTRAPNLTLARAGRTTRDQRALADVAISPLPFFLSSATLLASRLLIPAPDRNTRHVQPDDASAGRCVPRPRSAVAWPQKNRDRPRRRSRLRPARVLGAVKNSNEPSGPCNPKEPSAERKNPKSSGAPRDPNEPEQRDCWGNRSCPARTNPTRLRSRPFAANAGEHGSTATRAIAVTSGSDQER